MPGSRLPRWAAGAAALALVACAPTPDSPAATPAPSGPPASAAPNALPGEIYSDQQLVDIARAVVDSRNLKGMVIDTRALRSTAGGFAGPAVTSTTTPEICSAFSLPAVAEGDIRWPEQDVNFAQGRVPLDGEQSPMSTVTFVLRSAAPDQLAATDFDRTVDLMPECAAFERAYTSPMAGGGMTTTYEVQLATTPTVGKQAYATVQKAKGLGASDMGTAGMQVLAGTVSIELALSLWPVTQEGTERATDSMAGLARELIDQAVKNPPSSPRPLPAGARSPDDLTQLLAGVTGPADTKFYVSPTESRTISRASGSMPLPSQTPCAYDDAAYFSALADGATMAKAIASTGDKMISLDVTAISMGSALQQPFPFDTRSAAVKDCPTIQANITGEGKLVLAAVKPLDVNLGGESSYAFSYQAGGETGRWHIRLGARQGTISVEVSTSVWQPLQEADIPGAVDAATAVIQQALR